MPETGALVQAFSALSPPGQALAATLFTWLATSAGAAGVFFYRKADRRVLDALLGFAAGVMVAASYFSLLMPSIQGARELGLVSWLPATLGFLAGGVFLWSLDRILPHLHPNLPMSLAEGPPTRLKRATLLVLAITLHNIPEGLAIGITFGAAFGHGPSALMAAIALTAGIAIQDIPEGLAVSAPLRREGMRPFKAFLYGSLSGIMEPIGGVLGAFAVMTVRGLMPYALGFAAGAMLFVVVEELIPETQRCKHSHIATFGFMAGFAVMMVLDVGLG
jgi:ZIP family zinc transporter